MEEDATEKSATDEASKFEADMRNKVKEKLAHMKKMKEAKKAAEQSKEPTVKEQIAALQARNQANRSKTQGYKGYYGR